MNSDESTAGEKSLLEHISTHWTMIADPAKFVLRYAPAIRKYLQRVLHGQADTDDVAQDFLTRVLTRGFSENQVKRGRFRDYLRAAVRNAAIDHLRTRKTATVDHQLLQEIIEDKDDSSWIDPWRSCLLDKVWQRLEQYQRATPGNLHYLVLKESTEHPEEDSTRLAERVATLTGKPLRADTYRQQLHRARHKFAEFIVEEIRDTLQHKDDSELVDELKEIGLYSYVQDYLD